MVFLFLIFMLMGAFIFRLIHVKIINVVVVLNVKLIIAPKMDILADVKLVLKGDIASKVRASLQKPQQSLVLICSLTILFIC